MIGVLSAFQGPSIEEEVFLFVVEARETGVLSARVLASRGNVN